MHTQDAPTRDLNRTDLLEHYLGGALRSVESVDQLGNFLLGFGVLALGYLLSAQLGEPIRALAGPQRGLALATLITWGTAVALLLGFVYVYVFRVLVGRSVHALGGREDAVGEPLPDLPPGLRFRDFIRDQRTFADFLAANYRGVDQGDPEALLYARWSYVRFMTMRKLSEMNRMRVLLAFALAAGTAFKACSLWLAAGL